MVIQGFGKTQMQVQLLLVAFNLEINMDITLHPDKVGTALNDEGLGYLYATESKSGTTINIVLTPELEKDLMPLQEAERKKIADEAFKRGAEAGRSCQAILELAGRDKFIAELRDKEHA